MTEITIMEFCAIVRTDNAELVKKLDSYMVDPVVLKHVGTPTRHAYSLPSDWIRIGRPE